MKAADGVQIAERYRSHYAWAKTFGPLLAKCIEDLSRAEEREQKLRAALHEARDLIAVVDVENGLTIDNLIEMIDSALEHGNETLEAR
jgi:hypothetical protein